MGNFGKDKLTAQYHFGQYDRVNILLSLRENVRFTVGDIFYRRKFENINFLEMTPNSIVNNGVVDNLK